MDISINGAKIISAMPAQVPDRFELAFTQGDGKRRLCEVVWRRGKVIGVQFEVVLAPVVIAFVARSERFELPTLGIEIRCSIQLSYERVRGVDYQTWPGRASSRIQ